MTRMDNIKGAEQLIDVFGRWPSFHDAEVVWLKIDRRSSGEGCFGPTLNAQVHTFEITSEVDNDGFYVLRNHVLVHLQFSEVVESHFRWFNQQNALHGLTLIDISDRQLERVKWDVQFESAYGVDAAFQCHSLEVLSVASCDKAGEPI